MPKKVKQKSKTWYVRKADKLFSEYWREAIGHCEKCLKKDNLQLAHIITRDCRKLRYSRENSFVLCSGCHFLFHKKPLEFQEFVERMKGEGTSKYLIRESNILKPLGIDFYQGVIEELQALCKAQN